MQKKKQKQNNTIKQIILYALVVIIAILLTFAEDIVKLANKNKVGLLENTPDEITVAEPNIPAISAGMIPIKLEGDTFVITTMDDNDWYDYKSSKPAYIMLNDGVYQSELIRDMTGKELAENAVGVGVPDDPQIRGTILMWIPRFAINDETNDIKYIKDVEIAEEGWTIPEMFTYKQNKETAPDFLLTGIWFEKDVDTNYTNKINQMNQEESIYGFIANTKAVASDQTTGNTIRNYIENNENTSDIVGAGNARPQIDDITNPNRIILKIIHQKNQDPIKAKASHNKDTGLIGIQVTYSQYGISKILYENTSELKLEKNGRQALATTDGIDVEDGERTITIIDNNGNNKELKVQVMSAIYATLYTDGTLAFGKTENPLPEKRIRTTYGDISGKEYTIEPWYSQIDNITTVDFVNKIAPTSTAYWFYSCENLSTINNIKNLDTSNVTNMSHMFSWCSKLTSLDLSCFNTCKVTNMNDMFYQCSSLTNLNVTKFNTSNVTDMSYMFGYTSLTNIDISNFDTSQVTNMKDMFNYCSSLTSLDVSNFNTSNVTSMQRMFGSCRSLTSIDVSNFDTSNVTNMGNMFDGCSSLTSIDVSNFDTGQVTNMSCMFSGCSSLTSLDVSNFNTSNVTSMQRMFGSCSSLTSIDVSNFDTSQVTNMYAMFQACSSLTSLDLSSFDTRNVTTMEYMFGYCSNLKTIYVGSNWKLASNRTNIFKSCGTSTTTRK